jgi:hypothetical protein
MGMKLPKPSKDDLEDMLLLGIPVLIVSCFLAFLTAHILDMILP